ncbi:NAD(P)/FAD-dependent oxidoreductase [Aestuariicella hydrocarbonica]|uniref:NAD(P)/FAD-dependent oxidoreductase n=1 Tax=Pseudomaricurvus hydrocarbonicus TaxID=1470433 RepID=A0A9E5MKX3_9GAMM|nr:NAD(P)/FAD-dependent oxidoreductase [Aestuariicella hydrocarbonica]NHO65992.1 NAD(P)/FAD-dependent oxidoreductase [Aestuariicella hydrocarbonica]
MTLYDVDLPSAEDIDIPALKQKYQQERDRRMTRQGQSQYVKPVEDLSYTYEGDPYTPVTPREPVNEDIDVVILGGGWSGIMAGVELKRAGISNFRNIDHAGDFGGVWYWNRYPGLQCDNDAYCYLPLLEETGFMPSKKFTEGYEILAYAQSIAKQYELYEKALFHTLVNQLRWDESRQRWIVKSKQGDEIRARHLIVANGLLNIPKLPGLEGIHDFKGHMFHTARWDYDYTGGSQREPVLDKLADKKVAIVGTGATAVQLVPYLGKYAKQFYVLQRTPSCVDTRRNSETDPQWAASLKPGWQAERRANFHRGANERYQPGESDMIVDIWTEVNRRLTDQFNEQDYYPDMAGYAEDRDVMDFRVMERLRRRVDAIVEDRNTAEKLKPYYRYQCKRPTSNDNYYQTFNRPNVDLIDVSQSQGIQRLTEKGFVANGQEYEVDCIIFASGYEVTSDLDRRWGFEVFEGRNGLSMYDNWAGGYQTLHGVMTHGFPNMYVIGLNQGGLNSSLTLNFEEQSRHISYIIQEAMNRGDATVEPTEDAQRAYVQHIRDTAVDRTEWIRECTPSYFNNEGKPDIDENGNEKYRFYLGDVYGPGWDAFVSLLENWRKQGDLQGLSITRP